ncbi:metalloregulator ArsR/SmtB family transcription factor [Chitinispirillales bacterium ANBcel5]|uniref:ArsR/SmtB family transcription factor n=1 Tax=Cellulosispirillum alkaliphilum TaxID=3039283 RepID=UPI002A530140|nr:metalloregulator ArsR/SmtB family transcription factor [Chitinispirillales bacterium ANBcel5]
MNNSNLSIDRYISVTKALSDIQRVRVLLALKAGELCVCQIIEMLKLAPSTVSKHMSILKGAGLITSRKDGRWIYYRLVEKVTCEPGVWELIHLSITLLEDDERVKRDENLIKELICIGVEELCKRQKSECG